MDISIQSFVEDHREIEGVLDRLAASTMDVDAFRRVHALCVRHYRREEPFLIWLGTGDAALAAKLRGQHDEALELAARLEETILAGDTADTTYLLRRFLAIAQHNIIEEERDVFPLATLPIRP